MRKEYEKEKIFVMVRLPHFLFNLCYRLPRYQRTVYYYLFKRLGPRVLYKIKKLDGCVLTDCLSVLLDGGKRGLKLGGKGDAVVAGD
jgi:hypothetical protein